MFINNLLYFLFNVHNPILGFCFDHIFIQNINFEVCMVDLLSLSEAFVISFHYQVSKNGILQDPYSILFSNQKKSYDFQHQGSQYF